ncbi:MAG: T9SS type A sorting domain-containing protein, partial [Rhodothermia bacterium]
EISVADNAIDVGGTGVTLPLNEFGGASQSVMLTGNRIKAYAGIDLGEPGVSLNDVSDFDRGPNGMLNFPNVVQVVREGTSGVRVVGKLEGASSGEEYRIDFFVSHNCSLGMAKKGFQYGLADVYIGKRLVTPSLLDFSAPEFMFSTDGLQEGSLIEERHFELSMTSTREDLYSTSEFSQCVPMAHPDNVFVADVEPDQTGQVLAAQDVMVAVEGATEVASKSLSGPGVTHTGGRVYVSRFPTAPDTSVFAQSAASAPDGSMITPEAVAPLYWLLGETGLTAVADDDTPPTFEVCLALSDVILPEHRNRVVLMYRSAATEGAWMPLDTVPGELDGEPYLCAGGLVELGEFSFGGKAGAFKSGTSVGVEVEEEIPEAFVLSPNYPNPFNPQTIIGYGVPETAHVRIAVFDALGRQVALLVDRVQSAGHHQTVFNARNLPSGIYRYQFVAGNFVQSREMILLK